MATGSRPPKRPVVGSRNPHRPPAQGRRAARPAPPPPTRRTATAGRDARSTTTAPERRLDAGPPGDRRRRRGPASTGAGDDAGAEDRSAGRRVAARWPPAGRGAGRLLVARWLAREAWYLWRPRRAPAVSVDRPVVTGEIAAPGRGRRRGAEHRRRSCRYVYEDFDAQIDDGHRQDDRRLRGGVPQTAADDRRTLRRAAKTEQEVQVVAVGRPGVVRAGRRRCSSSTSTSPRRARAPPHAVPRAGHDGAQRRRLAGRRHRDRAE